MRIHFTPLLLFCILSAVLFSCKKNDVAIQNNATSKVKTYIEIVSTPSSNTSDTFNVAYDASNRVISVISTRSGLKFLYQYNSNPAYTLDIINGTKLSIRLFGFINNNSLLDSTFQFNDTNDSTTQKCIYNAAKQLTQFRTYDYSLSNGAVLFRKNDYTYDNNGNVIKDVESSATGSVNSTITYTYTNLTGTMFSLVTLYQPVQYKNLQNTVTYSDYLGNIIASFNCSYTFDGENRVTSQVQNSGTGTTVTKKFIYN